MITYEPLRQRMRDQKISYYRLANLGIESQTLQRLRHDRPITTSTLDKLCAIFECSPGDLLVYIPDSSVK